MPSDEEVTVMILEVDLKCSCCYKKVKKLLCKFPQIRDQVFDEDKNKVTITVVCCDPEKLRDKLCCKGGRAIQSIEIVEKPKKPPPKPVEPEKPKQTPPQPEKPKPKQLEKKPSGKSDPKPPPPVVVPEPPPKADPKPNPPPKQPDPLPMPPVVHQPQPKPQPPPEKMPDPMPPQPKPQPKPQPQPQPEPINMPMPYPRPGDGYPFCPPVSTCCQECYQGLGGGPCHYGYGRPVPPPPGPCYDGYPYGGSRPCYVSRCDYYFSEDNPQGCSIM